MYQEGRWDSNWPDRQADRLRQIDQTDRQPLKLEGPKCRQPAAPILNKLLNTSLSPGSWRYPPVRTVTRVCTYTHTYIPSVATYLLCCCFHPLTNEAAYHTWGGAQRVVVAVSHITSLAPKLDQLCAPELGERIKRIIKGLSKAPEVRRRRIACSCFAPRFVSQPE